MNNKDSEYKRSFVPKTLNESLKKINKNYAMKYGKLEYLILLKWSEIVGSFFAQHSEPEKIIRIKEKLNEFEETIYNNFLYVNVSPAAALEFEHFKDKIIEKINGYFGYKVITSIKFKQKLVNNLENHSIKKVKNKKKLSKNSEKIIKEDISNFKDEDLKNSILNLGLTINKEDT
ncbi:MAG: hypothetical protein CMI96_03940 [Pelagibacteraceae bacterium]|nr:hypothetical protein [Pelagibacteraceae bacterium]|tara:strand:- start:37687 stop:38211 length:525 start_codon:yes stop_codon:yes gene_type:complete